MAAGAAGGSHRVARLDLLGPVTLWTAGRRQPFAAERPLQLLLVLAVRATWVGRDEVAALFWPDKRNDEARRNLRRILHGARHLDFAPAIEQRAELLRWPVDTDLAAFDRALADGRRGVAIALVRGPLGQGMDDPVAQRYNDWLAFERGRLNERQRSAVLAELPEREAPDALALAERLLAVDEFDDEALRAKLDALARLGRPRDVAVAFRRYSERLAEELGIEPTAATRSLADRLATPAAPPRRSDVAAAPVADDGLVGRDAELQRLCRLVADRHRLVTLTGPGGAGKTRLARAVYETLQSRTSVPGGMSSRALWVDLYDLQSAAQVAPRLAAALGLTLKPAVQALDQVIAALAAAPATVMLDNCEQLVGADATGDGIAAKLRALLDGCPGVSVLATSRRRLDLPHEQLVVLDGLACPPADAPADAVLASDAARLFCLRAKASDAAFEPRTQASAIARIAALTDGLPLALELAAAWVRLLPCAEIALELEGGLDVLEPRIGNRGMRAVLERSWQLAPPHERQVLAQLSAFVGGFSREAARAVANATLPALANLADASLLRADAHGPAARFSLHPLVRDFARDKLAADPARLAAALDRHMEYHGRLLQPFAEFKKIDQKAALDTIGLELENCLAAWQHAVATRHAPFFSAAATALENYFNARGRFADGAALFERALAVLDPSDPAHLVAVTVTEASLAILQFRGGAIDAAEANLRRALSRARAAGLGRVRKSCLNTLGLVLWHRARWDEAKRHFAEALKLARADQDAEGTTSFLGSIAMVEKAQGRLDVAARLYARVAAMARQSSNFSGLTTTLNNLGNLRRLQGRLDEAATAYTEALAIAEARGLGHHRTFLLMNLALVAFARDDLDGASATAERALDAARAAGSVQIEANAHGLLARIAVRRADLASAQRRLADGLQVALSTGIAPLESVLLTWYGELLAAQGAPERAASVWSHVLADSHTEFETRQAARALLDAVDAAPRRQGAELSARLRREELLAEVMRQRPPAAGRRCTDISRVTPA
jgi:predicted ATPase/DNA-binding SARP family transcriptional activator